MAIAVRIIPPPRAGVNAKIRRGKLLLRLRMTSLGGATIHREIRTSSGGVRGRSASSLVAADGTERRETDWGGAYSMRPRNTAGILYSAFSPHRCIGHPPYTSGAYRVTESHGRGIEGW
jgi:hypothetical protein